MGKKMLAVLLTLLLVIAMVPAAAMADVGVDVGVNVAGSEAGRVTVSAAGNITDNVTVVGDNPADILAADAAVNATQPAYDFADMPDNWSTAALKKAVANGLLTGYAVGGKTLIKADAPLKRAEMAAVVNRAFGATVAAELKGVTDVPAGAWYAKDLGKAVQMGTFVLDGNMRPESSITRQEAFVVLARAFKITAADAKLTALAGYADQADIADWAKTDLKAMAAAGYVKGSPDGKLNPKANITRAEFASVMDNLVKQYIDGSGQSPVTSVPAAGNVVVRVAGVILSGVTVKGDLIIADGVGSGDAALDNVKVESRLVIRGGGAQSVTLTGGSSVGRVIAARADGEVKIAVVGDAAVDYIYVAPGSANVTVTGSVKTIEVAGDNLTVSALGAVVDQGIISGINSRLLLQKGSSINAVAISGKNAAVSGEGEVKTVKVLETGHNAAITTPNTKIEVAPGATGVTGAGGAAIAAGTSVTNNSVGTWIVIGTRPPVSSGGGGGGGGGSEQPKEFAGGSGTMSDPYKVATPAQLDNVRKHLDKHFIQTANIDLATYVAAGGAGYNVGKGWAPIGSEANPFSGSYNGNGKTIDNLKFVRPDETEVGLFSFNTGTISHVSLTGVDVMGRGTVGSLVAGNEGGVVAGCSANGTVKGAGSVGGLIGFNDESAQVTGCSSAGSVIAPDGHYVGGLIGRSYDSSVTDCYSTSSVTGGGYYVAGLSGSNYDGTISRCYATGPVTGENAVGGLVGDNIFSGTISDSYATGPVSGSGEWVGGLVGDNYSAEVRNCYAAGLVTGTGPDLGGLIGRNGNGATVTSSYWDTTTSGQTASAGGAGAIGYSTPSMIKETNSVAIYTGWDFSEIWNIDEGHSYPYFRWQGAVNIPYPATPSEFAGGSGTLADPYQVATPEQLNAVRNHLDQHFVQIADIDLADYVGAGGAGYNAGAGWAPIGTAGNPFAGSYNGDGYTVDGLTITRPAETHIGLFAALEGEIKNVTLDNVNISGHSDVGSLTGENRSGVIENCRVLGGAITGQLRLGGLCGYSIAAGSIIKSQAGCAVSGSNATPECLGGLVGYNKGLIRECYAAGGVSNGYISAGGLVGYNIQGTIEDSYATGNVSCANRAGGLAGDNRSVITNCYSVGIVTGSADVGGLVGLSSNSGGTPVYTSSYYDSTVTGLTDTGKGVPKTTAELQTEATFTGWDFAGTWAIDDTPASYPYLRWQGV